MEKSSDTIDKFTSEKIEDNISIILMNNDEGSATIKENNSQNKDIHIFKRYWFEVMGDIHADNDPHDLSPAKKNIIVFIVALSGLIGPASNFIYMPGINNVMNDMHTSLTGINATIAIYTVFLGIAVS